MALTADSGMDGLRLPDGGIELDLEAVHVDTEAAPSLVVKQLRVGNPMWVETSNIHVIAALNSYSLEELGSEDVFPVLRVVGAGDAEASDRPNRPRNAFRQKGDEFPFQL